MRSSIPLMSFTVLVLAGLSNAATIYWAGGSSTPGQWFDTNNWTGGVIPGPGDTAVAANAWGLPGTFAGKILINGDASCTTLQIGAYMGATGGVSGQVTLESGSLTADSVVGGSGGEFSWCGDLRMTGGALQAGTVTNAGSYYQSEGLATIQTLAAQSITIGGHCLVNSLTTLNAPLRLNGTLTVAGGTLQAGDALWYNLTMIGGYLSADSGTGPLSISSGVVNIGSWKEGTSGSVLPSLSLGPSAVFYTSGDFVSTALVGTVSGQMHFLGSSAKVRIERHPTFNLLPSTEAASLFFGGGTAGWATYDLFGKDKGFDSAGFTNNAAIGSLYVGDEAPSNLRLVDASGGGAAQYLHNLVITEGSTLDLNGLKVYYDGTFINNGTVINGQVTPIPEPATLSLLSLAGMALVSGKGVRVRRQGRWERGTIRAAAQGSE